MCSGVVSKVGGGFMKVLLVSRVTATLAAVCLAATPPALPPTSPFLCLLFLCVLSVGL